MEISEKESLMLVEKKEEILELTKQTLDLMDDPAKASEVKKNIMSVLSKISTIASYAKLRNKNEMKILELRAKMIFQLMDMFKEKWTETRPEIEEFCNLANSIQFDFKKEGFKIRLPDVHLHR